MEKDVGLDIRNEMATAAGDRFDVDDSAPLDANRIAQEAFGSTEPACKIEEFARFMALLRGGRALNGEQGGASARLLESAARAAEDFLEKLSAMGAFELVDALLHDTRRPSSEAGLDPMLARRRDTEAVFAFTAALASLPVQLRRRATSHRRVRGRPSSTEIIDFAIDQLAGLWRQHRKDALASDIKAGCVWCHGAGHSDVGARRLQPEYGQGGNDAAAQGT